MTKILYGVSGEGFGHAARSKEIITHLLSQGHQVKVLSYDRGYTWLKSFFDTEEIFGLRFTYKSNQVRYLPTIFRNVLNTPAAVRSSERIRDIINEFKPEIIFTDYEPLTCIAANFHGIPLVSLDNQHLLTRTEIKYPEEHHKDYLAAKIVTRLMVFKAQEYLVTNFFPALAKDKKTKLIPPIVRQEILEAQPTVGEDVLVYLTSDAANVVDGLKGVEAKFKIYGLSKTGVEDNLEYKPYDQKTFFDDLVNCKAIVANAGLSLICEALHLGKPYLSVPAKAQFEQILNAYYLEEMGYGRMVENLTKSAVADFLSNLDYYRKALKDYPYHDNQETFRAVDTVIKKIKK